MGNQRSRINSWTQYRRVSRAHRSVVTTDGEQVAILTAFVRNAELKQNQVSRGTAKCAVPPCRGEIHPLLAESECRHPVAYKQFAP
jgi:hypothetical protein